MKKTRDSTQVAQVGLGRRSTASRTSSSRAVAAFSTPKATASSTMGCNGSRACGVLCHVGAVDCERNDLARGFDASANILLCQIRAACSIERIDGFASHILHRLAEETRN